VALIVCEATDNADVVTLALPPLRVAVPSVTEPFLNVSVPFGFIAMSSSSVTVAVNVTLWPNSLGLELDTRLVDVAAFGGGHPPGQHGSVDGQSASAVAPFTKTPTTTSVPARARRLKHDHIPVPLFVVPYAQDFYLCDKGPLRDKSHGGN
jgi:hypothetical protein